MMAIFGEQTVHRHGVGRALSTPLTAVLQAAGSPMSPDTTSTAGGMASARVLSLFLTSARTCGPHVHRCSSGRREGL